MIERPEVKICGLSELRHVEAAVTAGADFLGFVFFPPSPRNISPENAAILGAAAHGRARTVAVTVNADDAQIAEIVSALRPDILQLHGSETPERVTAIRKRWGIPVVKAIPIAGHSDLARLKAYHGVADRILLDAKAQPGAALPGGNGVSFDWSLLADFQLDPDFFLSGGINSSNIEAALTMTRPGGIDISSGVESEPGRKSSARIFEILARIDQLSGKRNMRRPANV